MFVNHFWTDFFFLITGGIVELNWNMFCDGGKMWEKMDLGSLTGATTQLCPGGAEAELGNISLERIVIFWIFCCEDVFVAPAFEEVAR